MKEISELDFPDNYRYAQSHEWAMIEDELIVVGLSDYAQDQLGDVVFVELPEVGARLAQGDEFGTIESVKAVSEIYLPLGGEIMMINEELADNPALVNEDPYHKGWLLKVKPDNPAEFDSLMDRDAYLAVLSGA